MSCKLRDFLLPLLAVAISALLAPSQAPPPPLAPLLQQMEAGTVQQRERAFYAIRAIPHAAAQPQVQRVFVAVLQREDDIINSAGYEGETSRQYGEAYANYVGYLCTLVYRYAKLTNSENRPALLAILDAPGLAAGRSGEWLAGRTALMATDAARLASAPRTAVRGEGLQALAAFLQAGRSGRRQMTPDHARAAKNAVLSALGSSSADERFLAMLAVADLKDPSDAGTIAAMAARDPNPQVRLRANSIAAWLAKQPPVHHIAH